MTEKERQVQSAWQRDAIRLRNDPPRGILFLCVGNSARSQLAEAIARHLTRGMSVQVWSAGSEPHAVRPEVHEVLREVGIDGSSLYSKHVSEIPVEPVDTVVVLCAEERCPVFLGEARRIHWELPDPAAVPNERQRREAFRRVRDELLERLGKVFSSG